MLERGDAGWGERSERGLSWRGACPPRGGVLVFVSAGEFSTDFRDMPRARRKDL